MNGAVLVIAKAFNDRGEMEFAGTHGPRLTETLV